MKPRIALGLDFTASWQVFVLFPSLSGYRHASAAARTRSQARIG
jgi:hypothetical protein